MIDYNMYKMPIKNKVTYIIAAAAAVYAAGYVFYRNHYISTLLCIFALFYPGIRKKQLIERRKKELKLQFKDMLYCLSSSLSAGKSVELAFKDTLKDLLILYPDSDISIIKEVRCIIGKIEMNENVESILENFAERSHIEDISNFADVFRTCKRSGGNIIEIIRNTANIISDKIEIEQEIDTMLAQRKFEQKILQLLPAAIMLLISVSTKDYMEPVFNTSVGKLTVTIALIIMVISYFISEKIMDIKV